jgi:hypothetical protein
MWTLFAIWLSLPIPGLALLLRFDRASLAHGALPSALRACAVSWILLTPVSVLGYLFHWPVAVLSAAWVALLAAALGAIWRMRTRFARAEQAPSVADGDGAARSESAPARSRWRLGVAALVGVAWLAFDVWLGARVGSHVQGDAGFHVARIRMLLGSGLGSWDPLLEGRQFEPIYHTNLYHAWLAVSAQLARVDPGAAWIWAWPFAKLMIAAGSYELAWSVVRRRGLAWIAALTTGLWFATQSIVPYPNLLGPYAFLAFGLAATIATFREPSFRHAVWIGTASLLLAQTHMLYALFYALVITPPLIARLAYAVVRRRPGRSELAAALLAVGLSLPWLAVPALPQLRTAFESVAEAQAEPQPGHSAAAPTPARERKAGLFLEVGGGLVRMDPSAYLARDKPLAYLLGALGLYALLARSASAAAALAMLASFGLYMFVPSLCTALTRALGANWVMARLASVINVLQLALIVPLCAALVSLALRKLLALVAARRERTAQPRSVWLPIAVETLAVVAALGYVHALAARAEPWTIETIWQAALRGQAAHNAERITGRAQFFASSVEPGATVLAPLFMDYQLPMHCNCRALAFRRGRGARNVADIDARRDATERFYAQGTPSAERAELARRFGVRYVYSSPRRAPAFDRDLAPRVEATASRGADAILRLTPP